LFVAGAVAAACATAPAPVPEAAPAPPAPARPTGPPAAPDTAPDTAPALQFPEATAEARRRLPEFLAALATPTDTASAFGVLVLVPEGNKLYPVWLEAVTERGDKLWGMVDDVPNGLVGVKRGAVLSVPKDEVADWIYVDGDLLQGAFTLKAQWALLSEEERAAALRELGVRVD
jgi:uncharacterized protein YegJ (DUF2314 family)